MLHGKDISGYSEGPNPSDGAPDAAAPAFVTASIADVMPAPEASTHAEFFQ
jgi:hypothetical protein